MIENLYKKNEKIIKYAFFGGFGVLVDVLVYSLLVYIEIDYQVANAAGYLFGTMVSFSLNRHHTFKVKNKIWTRFVKFLTVALVGYTFSALLLHLLIESIELNEILSKLITLIFVLVIQFSLNKRFTFKVSV